MSTHGVLSSLFISICSGRLVEFLCELETLVPVPVVFYHVSQNYYHLKCINFRLFSCNECIFDFIWYQYIRFYFNFDMSSRLLCQLSLLAIGGSYFHMVYSLFLSRCDIHSFAPDLNPIQGRSHANSLTLLTKKHTRLSTSDLLYGEILVDYCLSLITSIHPAMLTQVLLKHDFVCLWVKYKGKAIFE